MLADETFSVCVDNMENEIVDDPLFAIEVYVALTEHHRRSERRDDAVHFYQQALHLFDFVLKPEALGNTVATSANTI